MATRVCHLCQGMVTIETSVTLFSSIGVQQEWVYRICTLLEVPVARDDGLTACMCWGCKNHFVSLEKVAIDFAEFKK